MSNIVIVLSAVIIAMAINHGDEIPSSIGAVVVISLILAGCVDVIRAMMEIYKK